MGRHLDADDVTAAAVISDEVPLVRLTSLSDIERLTHEEMCWLYRFAPLGHPFFRIDSPELAAFEARFRAFGGMTPAMSKRFGFSSTTIPMTKKE